MDNWNKFETTRPQLQEDIGQPNAEAIALRTIACQNKIIAGYDRVVAEMRNTIAYQNELIKILMGEKRSA